MFVKFRYFLVNEIGSFPNAMVSVLFKYKWPVVTFTKSSTIVEGGRSLAYELKIKQEKKSKNKRK